MRLADVPGHGSSGQGQIHCLACPAWWPGQHGPEPAAADEPQAGGGLLPLLAPRSPPVSRACHRCDRATSLHVEHYSMSEEEGTAAGYDRKALGHCNIS